MKFEFKVSMDIDADEYSKGIISILPKLIQEGIDDYVWGRGLKYKDLTITKTKGQEFPNVTHIYSAEIFWDCKVCKMVKDKEVNRLEDFMHKYFNIEDMGEIKANLEAFEMEENGYIKLVIMANIPQNWSMLEIGRVEGIVENWAGKDFLNSIE